MKKISVRILIYAYFEEKLQRQKKLSIYYHLNNIWQILKANLNIWLEGIKIERLTMVYKFVSAYQINNLIKVNYI